MPHVDILKLKNDGSQEKIAVCSLKGEIADCQGNESLVKSLLEEGIRSHSGKERTMLFPKDGIRFLEELKYHFDSGYLNATDIIND